MNPGWDVPVAGAGAWLTAEPPTAPTSAAEQASDSPGWLATVPATERKSRRQKDIQRTAE